MTWDDVLAEYAVHQLAANLSEKTIQNREACLLMLARRSGRLPHEITKTDLVLMLARKHARTGQPMAAGTKQAERSYLQTFFAWLVAEGRREDSPAGTLQKIKTPRRKARPLRMAQINSMLDSGAYQRTRDMITIAALTGLRIGEVVKIRGEDVDIDGRVIRSIRKGGLDHIVHMADSVLDIADRYPRGGWWFPSPYTNARFPDGGGHILMKSASSAIGKAIRRAGIHDPNLTGHSLRHYHATTLLREGVPIRVVQEMMGHASLATTQLYAEVTDEDMAGGVSRLPTIDPRTRATRRSGRIAA